MAVYSIEYPERYDRQSQSSGLWDFSGSPKIYPQDGLLDQSGGRLIRTGANGKPRVFGHDGLPVPLAQPALPHILEFASIWNTGLRTYSWRYDDAYRNSRENAIVMRRDCCLMSLLRERQYALEQTAWHIEPEDKHDDADMEEANYVEKIIRRIPKLKKLIRAVTEDIWYGRAAAQLTYDYCQDGDERTFRPVKHSPVNGDKIQFGWDDTPLVLVYAGARPALAEAGAEIVMTEKQPALRLGTPFWRQRFVIGEHDTVDADFYDAEQAGGVHGVGIRHWVYWMDWLKKEITSWLFDQMEKIALGITIYFYEEGNPQARAAAQAAAKQDTRNTVIVWPRSTAGQGVGSGIERIESSTQGEQLILEVCRYFDEKIERFVVGQTLSSDHRGSGGLGGSGAADFQMDTKRNITKSDCDDHADTFTQDLVAPIQEFNVPGSTTHLRWVYDLEKPDPEQALNAAKICYDMGIPVKVDEVRALAGLSKPTEDDDVVERPEYEDMPENKEDSPEPFWRRDIWE